MADIVGIGADTGDFKFDVDFGTGVVWIRVRPALGLETSRVSVPISILEFLDHAANLTLEANRLQRELMLQMRNGRPPAAKSIVGPTT